MCSVLDVSDKAEQGEFTRVVAKSAYGGELEIESGNHERRRIGCCLALKHELVLSLDSPHQTIKVGMK